MSADMRIFLLVIHSLNLCVSLVVTIRVHPRWFGATMLIGGSLLMAGLITSRYFMGCDIRLCALLYALGAMTIFMANIFRLRSMMARGLV
jgi:hypothetical protein